MSKEKKEKKNRKIPLWAKIIIGILLGIIALFVIAMIVIWIISPELFMFIITFVIPNLPKLMTASNMKAAWIMFTNDNAAIVEQIDANQQNKSETLGISAEVLAAIESGKYTEEEIALILDTKGEALAEIDAAKLAASENSGEKTENAEGVDDIMSELSPEIIAAIESGKYTEDEIALIIETKGEALADIDAEKEQEVATQTPTQTQPKKQPSDSQNVDPSVSQPSQGATGTEQVTPNPVAPPNEQPQQSPSGATDNVASSEPSLDTPPVVTDENKTPDETTKEPAPVVNVGEIINKHVAKLYIVKNRFVTELASLEKTIKSQYGALPDEQQVPTSRKEIAKQYISFVSDLELECDAEVEKILSDLKSELQACGGDIAIVDTVRTQYEEEKSLKKAYYLDVYMNGLPDNERSGPRKTDSGESAE